LQHLQWKPFEVYNTCCRNATLKLFFILFVDQLHNDYIILQVPAYHFSHLQL